MEKDTLPLLLPWVFTTPGPAILNIYVHKNPAFRSVQEMNCYIERHERINCFSSSFLPTYATLLFKKHSRLSVHLEVLL